MAFDPDSGEDGDVFVLDRKLWLSADRESVVEDGGAGAAFLLGGEGDEIPASEAERLGLSGSKPAAKQAPESDNKEAAAPANKARKSAKKKG